MRALLVVGLALSVSVSACGGGKKPSATPETSAAPPPRLPPSMGGGGPATEDAAKPTGGTAAEDVAKGNKAIEAGDYAAAKGFAQSAVRKSPNDGDAFALLGIALEGLKDKAGAEQAYVSALRSKPDHEAAAVNLSAIYIDSQRWDEAERTCRGGLEKHKDNPALHLNLAVALAGKKDRGESTKQFEEAVRLSPKQPMPLISYADKLAEWDQKDAAIGKLRTARGYAEGDVAMLATIAHSFLVLRAVNDCVQTFDKAIALKDASELRTERGLCKLASKDKAGATADFQAAIAKDPTYALAHYWLGAQHFQAGKPKDAKAELETYLKLAPTGAKAAAAKELLGRIEKK